MIIFYLSAVVVAGPLLMANPIGSRCFYVSYIFQVIAVLLILKSISAKIQINYFYAVVAAGVACMVICFIYFWMFREIGRYNDVRSQIIDNAIKTNEKSIELPLLPYSDYFWTTEPQTERWEKRFKKFYGLSEDVTVVFQ